MGLFPPSFPKSEKKNLVSLSRGWHLLFLQELLSTGIPVVPYTTDSNRNIYIYLFMYFSTRFTEFLWLGGKKYKVQPKTLPLKPACPAALRFFRVLISLASLVGKHCTSVTPCYTPPLISTIAWENLGDFLFKKPKCLVCLSPPSFAFPNAQPSKMRLRTPPSRFCTGLVPRSTEVDPLEIFEGSMAFLSTKGP